MDKTEFFANARTDITGPLAGVRVVEATTTWAGPMAGCVLADYGADVIKVEHPDGEVIRRLPPAIPDSTNTIANETVNRNKRNLSMDLRSESGQTGRRIARSLRPVAQTLCHHRRQWRLPGRAGP